VLAAVPAFALAPDQSSATGRDYAVVRGRVVVQSDTLGCSAYAEGSPLVRNTPPAGGWHLILSNGTGVTGARAGVIDVDRARLADTFFSEGQWVYGSFPLNLRKAMAEGRRVRAEIGGRASELTLGGSTAALIKFEECRADLTGWGAATSSRAGTFARSGD
jgi:hypothetical protein